MLDFMIVSSRSQKKGVVEIYPKFIIKKSKDLMIRAGDFYAIWVESEGLWSTDEQDALALIDAELDEYAKTHDFGEDKVVVKYMWDAESGMIDRWHKYCQKQLRDEHHKLDEKIVFADAETKKEDYASKKLSYSLEDAECPSFDKLISTLYSPEERHKIEWTIGTIVSGESKDIQKFVVLFGSAGTGKSTIINIIQQLFAGYCSVFDAKALGSPSNQFALEPFKSDPLVAIQHDGDLSKIEDNTRLNSLVSKEAMTVNEKFKSTYTNTFNCTLFVGSNKPVRITDSKSGLIRRLIDVTPSGKKLPFNEYKTLLARIPFELGAIANHCLKVYQENPRYYDDYIPVKMLSATNDFYNFVMDSYLVFKTQDGVSLKSAWARYKKFCEETDVRYPAPQRIFKEELKDYFKEYHSRYSLDDGTRIRNYYKGFKWESIKDEDDIQTPSEEPESFLDLKIQPSIFDEVCSNCPAQYAKDDGTPDRTWAKVKTKLTDLDTSKLHYVRVEENHIVIDFDIPDKNGGKSFERNFQEASKWPPTYAEVSKSGKGIHLHYYYKGDVSKLSRIFDEYVEIKIFSGNSSLRRKLTKCNNLPINTISSGLPLKESKKVINFDSVKSERQIRTMIKRNLNKEYHPNTKPSIDFINAILEEAYESGIPYDVSDMRNAVLAFAIGSTNQAQTCIKMVGQMKFKSQEVSEPEINDDADLVFYDVEVFPNLFLVNWKVAGEDQTVRRMINPTPEEIESLAKKRLVGFNCRRYDNHIMYARMMGYNNLQLYKLSKAIISGDRNAFIGEAYNFSYTDVYDFAATKQSLKKWEIELGIHHQELGLDWDEPVPEELWEKVAEYCDNDVIATEAVFNHLKGDFLARKILAEVAGMSVNDTTNSLTTRIIFGSDRNPQECFNYRMMGEVPEDAHHDEIGDKYTVFDDDGVPWFPGYRYSYGVSTYREETVGEGGYVYSEPGMYKNVALLDIASMHPSSIIAEKLFGDVYTKRFEELVNARLSVKHEDLDQARTLLDGKLEKYLNDESLMDLLAYALKIAINSVYGLTSAGFLNPFRDIRNKDNIVAKRGALFMINLKNEVQARGYTVAHIKTDSIKIPDADDEIIKFVMDYGKKYGYNFEHEATYDRMCLVNKSVYVAKYKGGKHDGEWVAVGSEFQHPYVFKTLFSKEPIEFEDICETKSVSTSIFLDMNENGYPDVTDAEEEEKRRYRIKCEKDESKKRKIKLNPKFEGVSDEELKDIISSGHNYIFVGRIGSFCPIKPGADGGSLMRKTDVGYSAVGGTKGYRWLEAETVKNLGKEGDVDERYHKTLVDEAIEHIEAFGDFYGFVA